MAKTIKELAPTLAEALGEENAVIQVQLPPKAPAQGQPPPIQPKRYKQLIALLTARPTVTDDEIIGYWKDKDGNKVADIKSGGVLFVNGLVSNMDPATIAKVKAEMAALKANPDAKPSAAVAVVEPVEEEVKVG